MEETGLGHPAHRPQTPAEHHPHPGERYPPTEPLARPGARHQGEPAILRPSRRLSRLRRRQALRRRGPADRRAALSGPVDLVRLQLHAARDSAGAPQGDPSRAALRARSRQPRRQGAAAHPGVLSARRTVPGERSRSDPPGDRHLRSAGAAAGARCCCAAIRSAASIRAWCSCRARSTTPRCASASSA